MSGGKEKKPYLRKRCISRVIEMIIQNPDELYEYNEVAKKLGISSNHVSNCLSVLSELGYMESEFSGRKIESIAKANEHTRDLWEDLLDPIGKVSINCDPYAYSGFYDVLYMYMSNEDERRKAIQNQLLIYDMERSGIGHKGGEELRDIILNVLAQGEMKLSHVWEEVNKSSSRKLSQGAVLKQLSNLVRSGNVEKVEKGYYRRKLSNVLG